jgi:ATP-dependent RNA helicase TDRD9
LTKSLHWDHETNLTELKLEWAAIANLKQRRGRAGRVQAGSCYRLITESFSQKLLEFPEPEVLRQPLDKLVLSVKRLDSNNKPDYLLSKLLTPPKSDKIERAILSLKEVGALTLYKKKKFCSDDGELTFAGKIMAELPIDLRFSKLILFGHVFGRLKSAIIIAAALSSKTFFTKNYKSDFEFYK